MTRQADVLDRVTQDLLTSSQVERGTVAVDLRHVDLLPLVQPAAAGRADVEVACPPSLQVVADPVRVVQMLANLLVNAEKYGAPPVVVRAERRGRVVQIRVVDAGPGVLPGLAERVFEQYTRGPSLAAGGTGIGLFVVRSLAEAQGGTVHHEPAPGGGACFVVCLPAAG